MRERPILFSAPMVRAILAGRKTQTRRMVKGAALEWLQPGMFTPEYVALPENDMCPHGNAGDRLWVRETWGVVFDCYVKDTENEPTWWRATDELEPHMMQPSRWRPSIHMPRARCRIELGITGVRVERLQDISEEDALAEGCRWVGTDKGRDFFSAHSYPKHIKVQVFNPSGAPTAKEAFRALWESINGAESWDVNPWTWALTFDRLPPTTPAGPQAMEGE